MESVRSDVACTHVWWKFGGPASRGSHPRPCGARLPFPLIPHALCLAPIQGGDGNGEQQETGEEGPPSRGPPGFPFLIPLPYCLPPGG